MQNPQNCTVFTAEQATFFDELEKHSSVLFCGRKLNGSQKLLHFENHLRFTTSVVSTRNSWEVTQKIIRAFFFIWLHGNRRHVRFRF